MARPYRGLSEYMDDLAIRQMRTRYRLSQSDLARIFGVSRSTVQSWEKEDAFVPTLVQYAINYLKQELAMAEEDKKDGADRPTSQAKA